MYFPHISGMTLHYYVLVISFISIKPYTLVKTKTQRVVEPPISPYMQVHLHFKWIFLHSYRGSIAQSGF